MSLARLVITAVTVEGCSKSEVARDYGVSRGWVQSCFTLTLRKSISVIRPTLYILFPR